MDRLSSIHLHARQPPPWWRAPIKFPAGGRPGQLSRRGTPDPLFRGGAGAVRVPGPRSTEPDSRASRLSRAGCQGIARCPWKDARRNAGSRLSWQHRGHQLAAVIVATTMAMSWPPTGRCQGRTQPARAGPAVRIEAGSLIGARGPPPFFFFLLFLSSGHSRNYFSVIVGEN